MLVGIDEDVRQIITDIVTAEPDTFWSDGLEDLLATYAADGDLRAGATAALELWRENVLTVLSESFPIDLDWAEVSIDSNSSLIDELVDAAAPDDPGPNES